MTALQEAPAPGGPGEHGSASTARTTVDRVRARAASWASVITTGGILIAMLIAGQIVFGTFVSPRLISSLFLDNAYLIVLAVGMTFVILTGGIDLSVGAVVAFTGVLGAKLLQQGWPAALVIPGMILAGTLIGAVVGVMVVVFEVQPFIASLAGMFLARGLAFVISTKSLPISDPALTWLQDTRWQSDDGWYITPTVILALLILIAAALMLSRTRLGRTIYAVGGDENSARLMGLPVTRAKIAVYLISGTCAGLAGYIFASYTGSGYSLSGLGMELDAIAAVVIGGTILSGGTGYVLGSLLGVMVYGLIEISITYIGADSWWTKIVIGALLLAFVVVQRLVIVRRARR